MLGNNTFRFVGDFKREKIFYVWFQLGEILKAYGHFQEAALHLRHVLELRPNHEPALAILKEMEASPDSTVHVYTLLIIGKKGSQSLEEKMRNFQFLNV